MCGDTHTWVWEGSLAWSRFPIVITLFGQKPVVGKCCFCPRPQVSRQMLGVGLKWIGWWWLSIVTIGYAYPLSRLSVHHLLRDSRRQLSMKKIPFYPTTELYFNQKPIRTQHGPVKVLNLFLLILFQHWVSKSAVGLPFFLLF